ncbi:MAG: cyclic nucleotide-binding/CBS domain-containing protein [Nitrospiraceae bacterium]|nr:MAG: cyclic nucleotide-binding/CBS domain-containing protein [Nitrospiraceae bacterium]
MTIEEVIEFLSKIQPFQELDSAALRSIAGGVIVEFYPKDTMILQQDGPPSDFLRIIKKGGVKVFIKPETDEEVIIDYRSEGDSFGLLSLIGGDRSRANVQTVEDTICYLVNKETIQRLLDSNAAFSEYFLKSFLNKYIDKTFHEMHNKSLLYGGGDKLLFTTPVGELASKNVATAPHEISIKDAAGVMSSRGISSLVLMDSEGLPSGIVTDRDLRDKVVSKGRDISESIQSIMSVPLMKVEARDYCFEALLKMLRNNIHHLLVVDEGRLKGIITNHDLMMLQGTSPISIVREIETQQTVEGLIPVSRKINRIVNLLLKEGAKASNITRIISEVNDRLVRKIIEIAERKFGEPPVPYCWIVFGSEGRKEQTFKTDQDNAIIYADIKTAKDERKVEGYFTDFSAFVRDSLVLCGFPHCPAGYMASNPKWRQPLKTWKDYFSKWINNPTPEALLFSLIFFDFRVVHGEVKLAADLRKYLETLLKGQNVFFARMAGVILGNRPPLGFFKSFIVEKSGEHKDALNLKLRGIGPIVDMARLFALEKGVRETSTLERLHALNDKHPIVMELGEEIEQAFEFITLLRIHHQIKQIEASVEPDNFINPSNLSNLERRTLKESFQLIMKVQDAIADLYRAGMVTQ